MAKTKSRGSPPVSGLDGVGQLQPLGPGLLVRSPSGVIERGRVSGITVPKGKRWMVLDRPDYYWCRPATGSSDRYKFVQGQFLLIERSDGRVVLLIPLVDGDLRAYLTADGGSDVTLVIEGALEGQEPEAARVLFVAVGDDPFRLVEESVAAISQELGTFRLRSEKRIPAFMDYLGWCTWDAFYHEVNEQKVLQGLETFRKGKVQPGFVILDDGWLDRERDYLNDFPPDKSKFPNGLAPMIAAAKQKYGVSFFGIWHAFQGYWGGLNPKGNLFNRYRTVHNRGDIRPWKPTEMDLYLVHPDDIYRFYQDFHRYLREQGADMVKVDGQSATEIFTHGVLPRGATMRTMQHALQGSVQTQFEGNVIHCMSNGSDVAYNLISTSGWRNSDDYFPKKPESHGRHVYMNAINALWTSHFSWPDWDMFWSGHPEGAYHAAARAISGGPVYVSDQPGKQDFDVLRKLTITGGQVLRCPQPALPTRDVLFVDPRMEDRLLKIQNKDNDLHMLGIFHCRQDAGTITDEFGPGDLDDVLMEDRFAVYSHQTRELTIMRHQERRKITLAPLGFDVITLSPIVDTWIAPIGLLDKYNSISAIAAYESFEGQTLRLVLLDGGPFGCWCASKPGKVTVAGKRIKFAYDRTSKLLTVDVPVGQVVEVVVSR